MTRLTMDSAGCLGCLGNGFRIPSVKEDSPPGQGSADRVDHEGSIIGERFTRASFYFIS
jgi:hypothetical protein